MVIFKNKKQISIIISWTIVILWMLLIFNLSSQVAEKSNKLSKEVTEIVLETVEKVASDADFDIDNLNHILRKNAHFFAYLVLGILVINAVRKSGVFGFKGIILTLGICILYAASDEVHQAFVPGRGAMVKDVLIDSTGVIVGIGMYQMISRMKEKVMTSS